MAPARYAPLAGWYEEKGNGQFIFTYPHWKNWETQNYTLLGENLMWSTSNKKLVAAWVEIHKDELMADWELAVNGQEVFKIEPLK